MRGAALALGPSAAIAPSAQTRDVTAPLPQRSWGLAQSDRDQTVAFTATDRLRFTKHLVAFDDVFGVKKLC